MAALVRRRQARRKRTELLRVRRAARSRIDSRGSCRPAAGLIQGWRTVARRRRPGCPAPPPAPPRSPCWTPRGFRTSFFVRPAPLPRCLSAPALATEPRRAPAPPPAGPLARSCWCARARSRGRRWVRPPSYRSPPPPIPAHVALAPSPRPAPPCWIRPHS